MGSVGSQRPPGGTSGAVGVLVASDDVSGYGRHLVRSRSTLAEVLVLSLP